MSASTRTDPSLSFRFQVTIGTSGPTGKGVEVGRFAECGGLEFEQEPFEYAEGGLNSRVHRLPGRFKFGNLTLKKGIATDGKTMWEWIARTVQNADSGNVEAYDVTVTLYDESGQQAIQSWVLRGAFPIKWSATAFSAEQNAIAFETLTLAHQGMQIPLPDRASGGA